MNGVGVLVRTHGGGHLSPLQHHVLGDAAVGVDVDALVLVAHQQLDAVCVGQDDDGVGLDAALDLEGGGGATRVSCSGSAGRTPVSATILALIVVVSVCLS